jgi:hypothetical protein
LDLPAGLQTLAGMPGIQLYKFHWVNPHPEAVIATIDLKSTKARLAPFLIAITAE